MMPYLCFASLQLTQLGRGSAQLALQVQRFGLGHSLFGQNLLHVVVNLRTTEQTGFPEWIIIMYKKTLRMGKRSDIFPQKSQPDRCELVY